MKSLRLFTALVLPPVIRLRLFALSQGLPQKYFRRIRQDNFHMTLVFLGLTPEEDVGAAAEALREAASAFPAFSCRLSSIGAFPRLSEPRVVWMGLSEGADDAANLSRAVREKLTEKGVGFDTKPFKAHITLAYADKRLRTADLAEAGRALGLGGHPGENSADHTRFPAAEAVLFQSESRGGGAVYRPLHRVRLKSL